MNKKNVTICLYDKDFDSHHHHQCYHLACYWMNRATRVNCRRLELVGNIHTHTYIYIYTLLFSYTSGSIYNCSIVAYSCLFIRTHIRILRSLIPIIRFEVVSCHLSLSHSIQERKKPTYRNNRKKREIRLLIEWSY